MPSKSIIRWAYKCLNGIDYMAIGTRKHACSMTAEIPQSDRIVKVRITELPKRPIRRRAKVKPRQLRKRHPDSRLR